MLNKIIEEAKEELMQTLGKCLLDDKNQVSVLNETPGILADFLSQSLTKGIQKAMEEIKLDDSQLFETPVGGDYRSFVLGYQRAVDELDTKINKLLK